MVLSVQREIGTAAFAGLPMSIIYCCVIVFDNNPPDRMVLRMLLGSMIPGRINGRPSPPKVVPSALVGNPYGQAPNC